MVQENYVLSKMLIPKLINMYTSHINHYYKNNLTLITLEGKEGHPIFKVL